MGEILKLIYESSTPSIYDTLDVVRSYKGSRGQQMMGTVAGAEMPARHVTFEKLRKLDPQLVVDFESWVRRAEPIIRKLHELDIRDPEAVIAEAARVGQERQSLELQKKEAEQAIKDAHAVHAEFIDDAEKKRLEMQAQLDQMQKLLQDATLEYNVQFANLKEQREALEKKKAETEAELKK